MVQPSLSGAEVFGSPPGGFVMPVTYGKRRSLFSVHNVSCVCPEPVLASEPSFFGINGAKKDGLLT
jgi:hypothetical protein